MIEVLNSHVPLAPVAQQPLLISSNSSQMSSSSSTGSSKPINNFQNQFIPNSNNNTNNSSINGQYSVNKNLAPNIRNKANEYFYRWFSENGRSAQLQEIITFIKTNNKIPKLNELQSYKVNESAVNTV